MSTLTYKSTIDFADGEKAETTMEISKTRVKLSTFVKGMASIQTWDRAHIASLKVDMLREEQFVPTLVMANGKEITLGFFMAQGMAYAMANDF